MDEITDNVFTELGAGEVPVDDPSLLTVILDLTPQSWYNVKDQVTLQEVTKSLLVFLNAHLSLNNANQVAFIASTDRGSKFLYPNPAKDYERLVAASASASAASSRPSSVAPSRNDKEPSPSLVGRNMYRQFRLVDEAVLEELNDLMDELAGADASSGGASAASAGGSSASGSGASTLAGALSMVLTYTNRMLNLDQSISTTTASAISTSTNSAALGRTAGAGSGSGTGGGGGASSASGSASHPHSTTNLTSMKSRVLVVTANDDNDVNYIALMNAIFAAQKMKLPIDVAKLGYTDSSYLQQASETTNGIYLHIEHPQGLIQVLCTAYFVEPSIRPLIILPVNANTNYRASCFITGKSVDMGFVCSVCLCIMSFIPDSHKCPTCGSKFDRAIIEQLSKGPVVAPRKKRKVDGVNGNRNGLAADTNGTLSSAVATPEP